MNRGKRLRETGGPVPEEPSQDQRGRGRTATVHTGRAVPARGRRPPPGKRCLTPLVLSSLALLTLTGSTVAGIEAAPATPRKSGSVRTLSADPAGIRAASSFRCAATGSAATSQTDVTGAVANGSADDSAAIQNAINAASQRGGGIVTLPAGTFLIDSHLVLRNNVGLKGAGAATVIKAGPGFLSTPGPGGGYPLISTAGASNTTISSLTADQSGDILDANTATRLSSYAVEGRDSSNVVVSGVYVRNPFTYSIAMVGSVNFCIDHSDVQAGTSSKYSQLDGIHILDSSSGQVINNVIQAGDDGLAAHTMGAPVHDVLFANNEVRGGSGTSGLQLAAGAFAIYDIKVEDNDFYGTLLGIHTGYYGPDTGSVHNVVISGNYIHDLTLGQQSPAISIVDPGRPGSVGNITVTGNRTCNAGPITVQPRPGNTVTGSTSC